MEATQENEMRLAPVLTSFADVGLESARHARDVVLESCVFCSAWQVMLDTRCK